MAAVTQTIPNFLGGVSKQTDIKKQPGQVRNCINAYPDPTFGLMKRPGFKFIDTIYTPASGTDPELKDAKWFFIKRDNLETYIGSITNTGLRVWNKAGTECTVHDDTYALTITSDGGNGVTTQRNLPVTNVSSSGSGMTVNIIDSGKPSTLSITAGGTGYSNASGVATTGGTGTGLLVDITQGSGIVTGATVGTAGTGYTVGDVVTVSGGGGDCTLTITGMDGAASVHVCTQGTNYVQTDTLKVATSAHDGDADLAFTLTTKPTHYLDTTRDNYDILTVQDTSIVTNKTKTVTAKTAPGDYVSKSYGTVRIKTVAYSIKYEINLKVGSTDYPVSFTTINAEDLPAASSATNPSTEKFNTAERILKELKGGVSGGVITTGATGVVADGAADSSRATDSTYALTGLSGSGSGTGAAITITTDGDGKPTYNVINGGTQFKVNETIDILDSQVGSGGGAAFKITVAIATDHFNNGLKNLTISGHTLTVTDLDASLELELKSTASGTPNVAFELTTTDSQGGLHIDSFNEQINTQADLPAESLEGRLAKVVALGGENDTFWLKFFADNGTSGKGNWEETVDPTVSKGMKAETLPHELFNSSANTFVFRQPKKADGTLAWKDRVVGDTVTNSDPSFVGTTIQQAFYHNNRLGFLTDDNVSMSKSNDFFNFYFTSALTATDNDPVDINCSSIRPAVLHAVLPTAQGLILFSRNQQFILFSDAEILTPSSAVIRGISNYEMDPTIDPVDVGTVINFVSKTPSYTRIFGMQTRGSEESPVVMDIGKIISEWVPDTINNLLSSPQNSLIALYGDNSSTYVGDKNIYMFKTYNVGDKIIMQAWFQWNLPGNVQFVSIDSDTMWSVIESNGKYHLISASLTQTPEETIITTADGQQINPHMDMYTAATNGKADGAEKKVVYDSTGDFSKCYIPYTDITTLNPVILIAGNATQDFDGVTEFGFTVSPIRSTVTAITEVVTDGTETYFKVKGKDLSSQADNVYVGYQYNYDVELPKTYFKLGQEGLQYDYTANLTISRMKFAVGLSSVVSFKVKNKGWRGDLKEFTGDGTITAYKVPFLLNEENGVRITLDGAVQPSTAYSIARTVESGITIDNSDTVTFTTAPTAITVKRIYGGSGYTTATGVDTTAANGSGLKVNTTVVGGAITDITIHTPGSGYVEGQIVSIVGGTGGGFLVGPAQKIEITTDTWYDVQTSQDIGQYLADDVPLTDSSVFTVPIHQRSDNFNIRVFSNSPFPVSLTSMMWEGQYSPRFYRRT